MKKAFTLVELIVVIGILAILMGILIGTFSGGTDSARAARCLSNMRNIAAACQSYGVARSDESRYPFAGSVETTARVKKQGTSRYETIYKEIPGWISWNSGSTYMNSKPTKSVASSSWNVSTYNQDNEVRLFCLTNGALWKYVSGNRETYRCPAHCRKFPQMEPNWSYVMNAAFGCTFSFGTDIDDGSFGKQFNNLQNADKMLLFAEMPYTDFGGITVPTPTTSAGESCDCILQYKGCGASSSEYIGFCHKVGKMTFAHVAFADGHTEKLMLPKNGLSESELQELTRWLCEGWSVGFDGKSYKKLDN